MSQAGTSQAGYRFDNFFIDGANRQLWRGGEPVALNSKYLDVLLLLVSRRGQLVEKQHIFDEIWEGVFVTDAALTQCVKDIRRQLGDNASNPRYIKTIPKHGYMFIADVIETERQTSKSAGNAPVVFEVNEPIESLTPRPYKFLDYYTEEDARLFFGRESEIETICSQIRSHRSFILHGRSGVGKSSILRAGLMPRLKAEGHMVFVVRSFIDPLHQIMSSLSHLVEPGSESDPAIEHLIQRVADGFRGRLLIFFLDQFEEFFSSQAEEIKSRFINTIADLIANDALPIRLIFALREDMLAEMSLLKEAIPGIFHHEYRLMRLDRTQAGRAMTEPARAAGCTYEAQLVERLLNDLADSEGVDPPQMQIVCDSLYDARDSEGRLTLLSYEELGGASQILAGYLERVLRRFNRPNLVVVKEILTALISTDGQRQVLRPAELVTRVQARSRIEAGVFEDLIDELVDARVVRRRSLEGEAWFELAHDFLTPEVLRWLTDDARALKRAQAVIERALENYRSHQLLIDGDALDLLLPFGDQLGLTGEEADLLLLSILVRAYEVPAWLVGSAPSSLRVISEAAGHTEAEVRLRAVAAAQVSPGESTGALLRKVALWDADLGVRKAASIAVANLYGDGCLDIFSLGEQGEEVGTIRRAVSLAMVRDQDKSLVRLSNLSMSVSMLVILGLAWVRLRRDGKEILRQAVGGMLGGAGSGFLGGLLLGSMLSMARHASALEALSFILVLVSMGTFIGAIGGMGVSLGTISALHITYRHSRWWSVAGGAAGGAIIGGSSKLLGVDTLKALFGQNPTGLTGALEGAVIGAGVSLGAVLAHRVFRESRAWQRVLGASLGAMVAGVLLTVIGGNLFSASLEIVARSFADSQIRMDPLAPFFGEVHFGQTTQIVMGAIEGLLFGAGLTAGIEAKRMKDEG